MAFTDAQKYKIIRLLGYPLNTLDPDSLSYSKIIADRLLSVPAAAEEEVTGILTRLEELDTQLVSAVNSTGVKKIDDIEFFSSSEGNKIDELRKERRKLIKELAMMLDIRLLSGGGSMGTVCI